MRSPLQPRAFTQVLVLRNPSCAELAPALWAAFEEVEQFYRWKGQESEFRRFLASPRVPAEIRRDVSDARVISGRRLEEINWDAARGRPTGTYESKAYGAIVRDLLNVDDILVVVTDAELTPPTDWRYIIWDECANGVVISLAPTDPRYWGTDGPARIATIKQRVRAAALNATGQLLGLDECTKPDCILFGRIESVNILDLMVVLGPEHGVPERTFKGYDPRPRDPGKTQRLIEPESIPETSSGDDP